MRTTSTVVVCLLATGCSRDLGKVTDRKAEPAYLGELSGLYELSLLLPVERDPFTVELAELPYGSRLKILHLQNPDGGDDQLLGVEEEPYLQDVANLGFGEGPEYRRLFFNATFDGTELDGGSNKGPIRGKRVAGGGMVTIDNLVSVCQNGPRYPLVGRLLCPVNPALSGVYGGEATTCGADEFLGERYLALAFIDDSFLGLSYPGNATLLEGFYNHYQEAGAGFSYGLEWSPTEEVVGSELWFNLAEVDSHLSLSGELFAFTGCTSYPCPQPVCEQLTLSRLGGGTANECYANDVAPAIGSATTRREFGEDGGRFLYVETQYTQLPNGDAGVALASGGMRRADNPEIVIEGEPPDRCTPGCPCDLDCCPCNLDPMGCDANCDCDWECTVCWCGVQEDGVCAGDCRCDRDCLSVCDCNIDDACTDSCFCDPDCYCDCERPPGYALRFPLPPVPTGVVQYELFMTIYDPYFYEEIPTAPRCIYDDGLIDSFGDPPPAGP